MNCLTCGAKLEDTDKFCTNCGAKVESELQDQAAPSCTLVNSDGIDSVSTSSSTAPVRKKSTKRVVISVCASVIALFAVILVCLFLWHSFTPKELSLDENTIKDETLRNSLATEYDSDNDGKLSEEELGNIQSLDINSGDDFVFINMLWNLHVLNVRSSDVVTLDLSQNSNLKKADFSEASNIVDLKLPEISTYDDIKLPDNDNLSVTFPSNSEYEVKYVPKKVEETRNDQHIITEQAIENANKVSQLQVTSTVNNYTSNTLYDFMYDEKGRVEQTKSSFGTFRVTQNLTYDEKNRLKNEQFNGPTYGSLDYYNGNHPIEYTDNNTVTKAGDKTLSYSADAIEEKGSSEYVISRWNLEEGKTTSFVKHVGNNSYYLKRDYQFNADSLCSQEAVESYCVQGNSPDSTRLSTNESSQIMNGNIVYSYDGNNLVKAVFDSGFEQRYEYDARGNLRTISSTGSENLKYLPVATSCSVEYSAVIAKKDQTPLSFIVLPGLDRRGLVNLAADTRQIAITSGFATADFSGKFWWDEENIISNQVEAVKAKNESSSSEKSTKSEDRSSKTDLEALNSQATEAYKGKIAEYAKFQGSPQSAENNDAGINSVAFLDFGTNIFYSLKDLNNDGVQELLIKCNSETYDNDFIADAYTYQDGNLKRILCSWARSNYTLCQNGYLRYYGSGGWNSWTRKIVKFEGEFNLQGSGSGEFQCAEPSVILELTCDGVASSENAGPFYCTREDGQKKQISEAEEQQVYQEIQNYQIEDVDWVPVTQGL